ncbi:MAG: glycosyltransferase family 4 protein [Patescibacteria group bacterium]|jgi:glycosyltransferase involved in cell wall biosynthesis
MRICFISNLFPPYGRGGAERVVEEEALALKALGHDVSIITACSLPEDGSLEPRMTVENGLRVHRFFPLNFFFYGELGRHAVAARLFWHLRDSGNGQAARMVERLLRLERPEIVHTHNLKGIGFSIPAVLKKLRIRHVHTLHDVQLVAPSGLILKGKEKGFGVTDPLSRMFASMARSRFASPDIVISPSRFLLRFHEEHGFFPRSQKILLPNPAPNVSPAKHATSSETRFLFLGQVETHKGVLVLIEAFRRLVKERPKARLDVVGTGSAMDAARTAAGKDLRISFYGKKNPAQFPDMFSKTDYTVVPSLCYENAPTVIVESFAYGVPVAVASIGGAAELVRNEKNGFVFEADNVGALVATLTRACDEKSAWMDRSRAAVRTAELLLAPRHAARLESLYDGRDPALEELEPIVPMRYQPSFT